MAESIFGDCMVQYQPGREPTPEPKPLPYTYPELAGLEAVIPTGHPDHFLAALCVHELLELGFDPNDVETVEMARTLVKIKDAQRSHRVTNAMRQLAEPEDFGPSGVVYYMKMRDLIKIGYTSRPVELRRKDLLADEVLATEPGSYKLEAIRHRQFADYLYEGERFYPGKDLLKHIAVLRST